MEIETDAIKQCINTRERMHGPDNIIAEQAREELAALVKRISDLEKVLNNMGDEIIEKCGFQSNGL